MGYGDIFLTRRLGSERLWPLAPVGLRGVGHRQLGRKIVEHERRRGSYGNLFWRASGCLVAASANDSI